VQPATSLLRDLVRKRDFYAGGLMLLIGLGIALKGATYRAGTLMHMGPGFLPTALGILLVLLGLPSPPARWRRENRATQRTRASCRRSRNGWLGSASS